MINLNKILALFCEKIVKIKNDDDYEFRKVSKTQLTNFYKLKDLTSKATFTPGSNWTISTKQVQLTGNIITTYIIATAKTATDAGAIANQTICTIKIPTSGDGNPPILDFYQSSGNTYKTGGVAIFKTSNSTISNGYLSYDVSINSTHSAISSTSVILTSLVTFESDKIMSYLDSNI